MTLDWPAQGGGGGIVMPLERNRWIVTLVGRHGDIPPADREGFLAYAGRRRTPTVYDAIKNAKQLGEIARFGFPASVRRHFDRLEKFARGLLPLGDALCRFNPVYGQGMSVAAQEAGLLHALLHKRAHELDPLAGLAPDFFAAAAPLIDMPWSLAAVPDLAHSRTQGQRPEDLQQRLDFGEGLNRPQADV
jgi:2-polyprenyl-6-methoxyphenol hydroxylase-like FAD-dependent oxidoreductase